MKTTQPTLLYRVVASHPAAHLFTVTLTIAAPDVAGQVLTLPAWVPGSYMIRELAKNIVTIKAWNAVSKRTVKLTKLDKQTWRAAPCKGALVVEIEVYAWDLSVRTAHLDRTHGFFNGTSLFLQVVGQEHAPHTVELVAPQADKVHGTWRVATSLPQLSLPGKPRPTNVFGLYQAADYQTLVDHPVEMGAFTHAQFEAGGEAGSVLHEIAITGKHRCDLPRLIADMQRICAYQLQFFGRPADLTRYAFLITAVGDGYGGLEHRASTALICGRDDLPHAGMKHSTERYRTFLGLVSHEYFHTWNVKRIKPAAFTPYDLATENYTRQLWFFEGFTSYYDDLVLVRTGLLTREQYLASLAKTITTVRRGSGAAKQSVAESSFDAWTKYYRQDENAPNAVVSYYAKGALVALALDLMIRSATKGQRTLDEAMLALWREHGQTGVGLEEGEIEEVIALTSGVDLTNFFARVVHGTQDAPLEPLFAAFGLQLKKIAGRASLGVKTQASAEGIKLAQVWDGGAAQAAGLSAGDVIVAIDGIRATAGQLDDVIERADLAKRSLNVHAFRRDELMQFIVTPTQDAFSAYVIEAMPRRSALHNRLESQWLKP